MVCNRFSNVGFIGRHLLYLPSNSNIRDRNNINFEDLNILVKFLKRKYIRRMSTLDGLSK